MRYVRMSGELHNEAGCEPASNITMPESKRTILGSARRYGIAALGWFVIAFGVVIGPILLVPVGVAILAWEFPWARRMLRRAKARVRYWWRRRRATRAGSESER